MLLQFQTSEIKPLEDFIVIDDYISRCLGMISLTEWKLQFLECFWSQGTAMWLKGVQSLCSGVFQKCQQKTVVLRICTQKMLCKKRFESCFHMYPQESGPLWCMSNILFAFLKHPFVQWAGRWSNLVWFPSTQYLSITTIRFSFLGGSCWYWVRHQVPDHNSIKKKTFQRAFVGKPLTWYRRRTSRGSWPGPDALELFPCSASRTVWPPFSIENIRGGMKQDYLSPSTRRSPGSESSRNVWAACQENYDIFFNLYWILSFYIHKPFLNDLLV